jgi:hypothetical protein
VSSLSSGPASAQQRRNRALRQIQTFGRLLSRPHSGIQHGSVNASQYENRLFRDNNCINPRGVTTHPNNEEIYEAEGAEEVDKSKHYRKQKGKAERMKQRKNIKKTKCTGGDDKRGFHL